MSKTDTPKLCPHLRPLLDSLLLQGAVIGHVESGWTKTALAVALDKGPQPAVAEAQAATGHLKFWKNDDSRSAIEYGWRCDEHKHTLSWPQSEATIASI